MFTQLLTISRQHYTFLHLLLDYMAFSFSIRNLRLTCPHEGGWKLKKDTLMFT
jgi:hypothetical protein